MASNAAEEGGESEDEELEEQDMQEGEEAEQSEDEETEQEGNISSCREEEEEGEEGEQTVEVGEEIDGTIRQLNPTQHSTAEQKTTPRISRNRAKQSNCALDYSTMEYPERP
jgi:hypothetical protein